MVNDLISDMLTRIRNATMAKHSFTIVPYSKVNAGILKILVAEGFIQNYQIQNSNRLNGEDLRQEIKIILKYKGWWIKNSFISEIHRISKPGKRVYSGYKNFQNSIDTLSYQQGIAIISTSMGLMSHMKAVQFKKGGEILCYVG